MLATAAMLPFVTTTRSVDVKLVRIQIGKVPLVGQVLLRG